jgi:MFS family permease
LNAAVVISWIAYHNYQPKVLIKFDMMHLKLFLIIAQALILVLIPPIAGWLGDYMIKQNGNRFVVFTVGISVTAMIFMAVAFSVSDNPFINLKWLLPIMIVLWLISMNIFHSPANSMIELFAPGKQLPVVMSIIAMITELLRALEPIIINLVDFLGATLTFVTGGVLLIVTGFFFRRATRDQISLQRFDDQSATAQENNYTQVIAAGFVFGLATAILMNVFPDLLASKLKEYSSSIFGGNHFVSLILAVAALFAIPSSKFTEKLGIQSALIVGLIITFVGIFAIYLLNDPIATAIACVVMALGYSVISVSSFPFAINNLTKQHITFGAGLFFGSAELADGILNYLQTV